MSEAPKPDGRIHYRKSWLWLSIALASFCGVMLFNQSEEGSLQGLFFFVICIGTAWYLLDDQTIDKDFNTFQEIKDGNLAFAVYKLRVPLLVLAAAIACAGTSK
jgi:hypothetical protein